MKRGSSYTIRLFGLELTAAAMAILFMAPFYFIAINSLKGPGEILVNPAGWPSAFEFANYATAWARTDYLHTFANSLIVTIGSIAGILMISTLAAYRISRFPSRFNQIFFALLVSSMIIPFQVIMIPLVKLLRELGLINSQMGLMICYFGFGVGFSVFLLHGFLRSIPLELEEAGIMDGCSMYGVFFRIVAPLLKPIIVTLILLHTLFIWNDFLLPYIVLPDTDLWTLPLTIYQFFGQYSKEWNYALPLLVMGIAPMIVFFIFLQKHVVEGITAGSVKG